MLRIACPLQALFHSNSSHDAHRPAPVSTPGSTFYQMDPPPVPHRRSVAYLGDWPERPSLETLAHLPSREQLRLMQLIYAQCPLRKPNQHFKCTSAVAAGGLANDTNKSSSTY